MLPEAEKSNEKKTITEQLDALFAPWNRTDTPGVIVGISKDGEVIYRRGFGMSSLETYVANTPRTRMRIASVSKHFTGMLALLLAEDGKLDLDVPVRRYLPELAGPGGDPSIRLLLQHRGGSRCYLDLGFLSHGMGLSPVGWVLEIQARQRGRNFAPGETMIYNNGGYQLVSLAIERAGGASFEAQLKQRLFDPLMMFDTDSVRTDYDITPGQLTMHTQLPDGGWRRGLLPTLENRGDGAIVSTIDDMLRWTAHLRSRDRFGSASTWVAFTELPVFPDGSIGAYALGLMVGKYRGLPTLQHGGGAIGGTTQMLTFPNDGLDVVIFANGAPGADVSKLGDEVADIILTDKLGERTPPVTASGYDSLLGDWWSPETEMLYSLNSEEEALTLGVGGATRGSRLVRLANGQVVVPGGGSSEVAVSLDDAAQSGSLAITVSGRSSAYRKLSEQGVDRAAFASAATGEYYSYDADTTATISGDNEKLRIVFSDPYGQTASRVYPLGATVARLAPDSPDDSPQSAVISATLDKGRFTGFRFNAGRTRNLEFTRTAKVGSNVA